MNNCKRCGRPYYMENDHSTCDELSVDERETWQTPEEIATRAEVLERQRLIKYGPPVTVEDVLAQIHSITDTMGKK